MQRACLKPLIAVALGGKDFALARGGEHQTCFGKAERRAAIFSDQMCETILRGISLQLRSGKRLRSLEHGICHVDATVLDGDDSLC